ncbi:MAG: TlpA family protein disulfide reductase [Acidobacteria bacterium]|nr:TlpA family protein disulfide reductase [Acidobacteriota bacterium]
MRKSMILLAAAALVCAAGCRKKETPAPTQTATTTTAATATARGTTAPPPPPAQTPATSGVDVGSTLPAYTATTLDGKPFDLASTRGKVVLVNLWATWCGPCVFEIPELEKVHQQFNARGFEVIGVSLDEGAPDNVKQFVAEHKMTYPVVLDPEGKMANVLQTSMIPTSVLLDRNGKIVWKKYEALTGPDAEMVKAIETALQ